MLAPWVMDEMKTAKLNDKRLNERLKEVLSQLAARPTASIPAACGGRAEMVAAYRFCENEKTSLEAVLQPHSDATRQRMAAQPVVILPQDTTEVDLTRPEQQVAGAGPLDGNSRRGALLHVLGAFTPDGTPLGTVRATAWVREEEPVCAPLSRAERAAIPIEEKESYRWVVTLQRAREEAQHCPTTQFICVADSESDIYEVLVEGTREPRACDWIVRARYLDFAFADCEKCIIPAHLDILAREELRAALPDDDTACLGYFACIQLDAPIFRVTVSAVSC